MDIAGGGVRALCCVVRSCVCLSVEAVAEA